MKPLTRKNLLFMAEAALGSHQYQELWMVADDGSAHDVMKGGEVSCAWFASNLLAGVGLIKSSHATVTSTERDLVESGWRQTTEPRAGDVVIWKPTVDHPHEHIGFYLSPELAISNSSKLLTPAKHPLLDRPIKAYYTSDKF